MVKLNKVSPEIHRRARTRFVTNFLFGKTTWILALMSFAMIGCVSPKGKVVSQKDPSFHGKLQKVLLIFPDERNASALGKQFSQRFFNHLTNSLAQQNIPATSVELDKDSLDNDPLIEKAAKQFRPTQWLAWSIAGMNTFSTQTQMQPGDIPTYKSGTSVTLEFKVVDVWVNRTVWRARFHYQMVPTPETVADQLVEELSSAKLLVEQSPQQNR